MTKGFDAVVAGSGTAAYSIATRLADAGRAVLLADFRPFGGTCALRGCHPKKVLYGAAEAHDALRRHLGRGIAGEARIDWRALMDFKESFTSPVPAETEHGLAGKGVEFRHGRMRFVAAGEVEVEGERFAARHVVLAMGAEPVRLGMPGEELVATSDDFLSLPELPGRIVLIGGGYIAAELSNIAARAGARVTILQRGPRMLKGFEPDLVGALMAAFRAAGIDVRTNRAVARVEKAGGGYLVHARGPAGEESFAADLVVHAAGRHPALAELDPQRGELAVEKGRLVLNRWLQSESNPAVYAAGDAAQAGPPLTPVASLDAHVVAANILQGNRTVPDYRGVASVAFTLPPIASVGLTAAQAREKGLAIRVSAGDASGWFTARQAREPVYAYKVLVEEGSERIVGAHVVGPHAEETINLFALAIRAGLPGASLRDAVFAYPTAASDVPSML
jgi:glutathione reductase (NADPH)